MSLAEIITHDEMILGEIRVALSCAMPGPLRRDHDAWRLGTEVGDNDAEICGVLFSVCF